MKTIEEWKASKRTPEWVWAMVLVVLPQGSEIAEQEYDALCERLSRQPIAGEG